MAGYGFTLYAGGDDRFTGLNLGAFEAHDIRAGQWTDGGELLEGVLSELLLFIGQVNKKASELIRSRSLLPFGAIYVVTGTPPGIGAPGSEASSTLYETSEASEPLFIAALRARYPAHGLAPMPRRGLSDPPVGVIGFEWAFPGLYICSKKRGWVYTHGAHTVEGTTLVAPQLLRRPVRLAFAAVHEAAHFDAPVPSAANRAAAEAVSLRAELQLGRVLADAIRHGTVPGTFGAEVQAATVDAENKLRRLQG